MREISRRIGALETQAAASFKGFRFVLVQQRDGKPWRKSIPYLPEQLRDKADDEIEWMSPDAVTPITPGFLDVVCNGYDIRNRLNQSWARG